MIERFYFISDWPGRLVLAGHDIWYKYEQQRNKESISGS